MRIIIVGPGAMGCLFAACLARSGAEVVLLDHNSTRAAQITRTGITVDDPAGDFHADVSATAKPRAAGIADLLMICTKSYATAEAAEFAAPCVGDDTTVLTLQNGLDNTEILGDIFSPERVIGGTTAHGATLLDTGHIRHTGVGETVIGSLSGAVNPRLIQIKEIFDKAGLSTTITTDLAAALWGKLVINCAINPLAALTRRKNGELLIDPGLAALMGQIANETTRIANAIGIKLPYKNAVQRAQEVCKATASNTNSMLADVLTGRRTEINEINGAVVRTATEQELAAPLNALLVVLVEGIKREGSI
jgi:2-dehydropantoate 2-reductase